MYRILFTVIFFTTFLVSAQSIESYMNVGNRLLANGAYNEALTKFRTVISREPSNFEARFNLGLCYLGLGRNNKAIKEFKTAASIDRSRAEVWSNLAVAYENLGKRKAALDALYRAVQYNPQNIQARINLATVYATNRQLNKAIRQYKEIIQLDGANLDAYLNLSTCLVNQKKYVEARHYLSQAIALSPNEAQAYWELGNINWRHEKKPDVALKNYEKAILLEPNSQVYYENLALLQEEFWRTQKDDSFKNKAVATWEQFLIYLNDPLKKQNIRERVEQIKSGKQPGVINTGDLFANHNGEERLNALKQEFSRDKKVEKGKAIDVNDFNVTTDVSSLTTTTGGSSLFSLPSVGKEEKKKKKKEE